MNERFALELAVRKDMTVGLLVVRTGARGGVERFRAYVDRPWVVDRCGVSIDTTRGRKRFELRDCVDILALLEASGARVTVTAPAEFGPLAKMLGRVDWNRPAEARITIGGPRPGR